MSTATQSVRPGIAELAREFDAAPGYLAAASCGVAPRAAVAAMAVDTERWRQGYSNPIDYDPVVARTRAAYAKLVQVRPNQVAIGSQTSVLVSIIAASLPAGAEVLVAAGDFTSVTYPFLAGGRLRVREAEVADLAAAITDDTALVAFSLIQSASGEVAPGDEIVAAARLAGAATLVDLTQAAGVYPVDASQFDATVCHAYKWLCAPRGVAFLTLRDEFAATLNPAAAGWYAGADPWCSIYGCEMELATDARRFDVSPAWQAFVGAEAAISLFAAADLDAVWRHSCELADSVCRAVGEPELHQAIISIPDPTGERLRALTSAGIRAAGRAGRLRLAFHVWNTEDDVAAVLGAISGK